MGGVMRPSTPAGRRPTRDYTRARGTARPLGTQRSSVAARAQHAHMLAERPTSARAVEGQGWGTWGAEAVV